MYADGSLSYGGVCPISVEDIANTRGVAYLNLSPAQQALCGAEYQEGLKIAFERGEEAGMPIIDLSDNMPYEYAKSWATSQSNKVGYAIQNPLNSPMLLGGIVLGAIVLLKALFD